MLRSESGASKMEATLRVRDSITRFSCRAASVVHQSFAAFAMHCSVRPPLRREQLWTRACGEPRLRHLAPRPQMTTNRTCSNRDELPVLALVAPSKILSNAGYLPDIAAVNNVTANIFLLLESRNLHDVLRTSTLQNATNRHTRPGTGSAVKMRRGGESS